MQCLGIKGIYRWIAVSQFEQSCSESFYPEPQSRPVSLVVGRVAIFFTLVSHSNTRYAPVASISVSMPAQ